MIQVSRTIDYDARRGVYELEAIFDGENETLVFRSRKAAASEQQALLEQGATIIEVG